MINELTRLLYETESRKFEIKQTKVKDERNENQFF